jgi:hypothetical protein
MVHFAETMLDIANWHKHFENMFLFLSDWLSLYKDSCNFNFYINGNGRDRTTETPLTIIIHAAHSVTWMSSPW